MALQSLNVASWFSFLSKGCSLGANLALQLWWGSWEPFFYLDGASHSRTVGSPAFPFPPTWWELRQGGRIPWETHSSLQPGPSQIGLSSSSRIFLLVFSRAREEGYLKPSSFLWSIGSRKRFLPVDLYPKLLSTSLQSHPAWSCSKTQHARAMCRCSAGSSSAVAPLFFQNRRFWHQNAKERCPGLGWAMGDINACLSTLPHHPSSSWKCWCCREEIWGSSFLWEPDWCLLLCSTSEM